MQKQEYVSGINEILINTKYPSLHIQPWKNMLDQDKKLEINIDLIKNLKKVNKKLWEIEDNIRIKESNQEFDEEFIKLARSVYIENDKRASIKKEINQKYNSELVEEKSYKNY